MLSRGLATWLIILWALTSACSVQAANPRALTPTPASNSQPGLDSSAAKAPKASTTTMADLDRLIELTQTVNARLEDHVRSCMRSTGYPQLDQAAAMRSTTRPTASYHPLRIDPL